jgi:menaquinone-dependent protoporphyrinogen oxidase
MKVLVAYGSRHGGTAGLAEWIAQTLHAEQLEVECKPAAEITDLAPYDAVILGGALYAHRWCRDARRFVARHAAALRHKPVWMFSSGPLDDSAINQPIDPVPSVAKAMARVGARGHVTFGGRLDHDAKGFIASRMAKQHAGDWRDEEQVRIWATDVARDLATNPASAPFTPQRCVPSSP